METTKRIALVAHDGTASLRRRQGVAPDVRPLQHFDRLQPIQRRRFDIQPALQ
jgi:hypothetical protein